MAIVMDAYRILVVWAFTVHQVRRLLSVKLPKSIQKYQVRTIIVAGLLSIFDEHPNIRMKDLKKEIARTMKARPGLTITLAWGGYC
jgi:hypothetical protein